MVLSGPLGRVRRQGLAVVVSVTGWGAAFGAFGAVVLAAGHALTPDAAMKAAIVAMACAGAADAVSAVFRTTILQAATPDHLRGRLAGRLRRGRRRWPAPRRAAQRSGGVVDRGGVDGAARWHRLHRRSARPGRLAARLPAVRRPPPDAVTGRAQLRFPRADLAEHPVRRLRQPAGGAGRGRQRRLGARRRHGQPLRPEPHPGPAGRRGAAAGQPTAAGLPPDDRGPGPVGAGIRGGRREVGHLPRRGRCRPEAAGPDPARRRRAVGDGAQAGHRPGSRTRTCCPTSTWSSS